MKCNSHLRCRSTNARLEREEEKSHLYKFKTIDMIHLSDIVDSHYLIQNNELCASHLLKIEKFKDNESTTEKFVGGLICDKSHNEESKHIYTADKIRKLLFAQKMPKDNLWRDTLIYGIPNEWYFNI